MHDGKLIFCSLFFLGLVACGGDGGGSASQSTSETQTWNLIGFAVGARAGNHLESEGTMVMPDVITLPDGTYRMYYNQVAMAPIYSNILVADSIDGVVWTPVGVALSGSHNDQDRTRILGGPSCVRLPDGRYRMFTRCSKWVEPGEKPDYHIRSAISIDGGLTFADEGIRIDNVNGDPSSPWLTAAHGRVYQLKDGTWAGVFSVEQVDNPYSPADLALFTSADTLTWTYQRILYQDYHDPVVVRDGEEYVMAAYYLREYTGLTRSSDGLNWTSTFTPLTLEDPLGIRDSAGATPGSFDDDEYGVGDHGALIRNDGTMLLYSNFGDGNSSIAIFELAE